MLKLIKQYWFFLLLILIFAVVTNGLALYFPKKVGEFIDAYKNANAFENQHTLWVLGSITILIILTALIQAVLSSFTAEKMAKEMRMGLVGALKGRSFSYIRDTTSSKLITILTSDVDAVKNLISSGIVAILMAAVTLIGAIVFLLVINWKLGLATLAVVPLIALSFGLIFRQIGALFGAAQMNLDKINKVINESIIASSLVRVLNAEKFEIQKYDVVNEQGTFISRKIVTYFAALVPVIVMLANVAILVVLYYGGIEVVNGKLTLGEMSAFFSYTSFFYWPFFVLAFSSQFVSRAQVSLDRINSVINVDEKDIGLKEYKKKEVTGEIEFKDVSLKYGEKEILKNISFEIRPGSKTAIVGPTGAGKTELFYLMAGLATPTSGQIIIDGIPTTEWDTSALLSRIGMVFQDSIIFQDTLHENIMFNAESDKSLLDKAIETSDLKGMLDKLEKGIETDVSERGMTLSGGQKQRVMLARALTINPAILLLDDFTARVDAGTEERIVKNLGKNFPDLTLISITQKIEPIKNYDKIIVLMEGEMIAEGKHEELIKNSLEYWQIYESQHSTQS